MSYRKQSISKSMEWFLYDRDLRHERVNGKIYSRLKLFLTDFVQFSGTIENQIAFSTNFI